jgi:hypothetical protein
MKKRISMQCIYAEIKYYLDFHPDFVKDEKSDEWRAFRKGLKSYFAPPKRMEDCCPGWIPSYCIPASDTKKLRARRTKKR